LKKVEEGDGSEAKGREAKRREAKGREAKGREAKGSDGKRREGKRSKGKRSEVKRREAKGREAKGRGAKGRKGKRRLKKVEAMVSRKAASFSMIPRDPKETFFLGSSTWCSHRASNVRISRFRECKMLLLYAPANHGARFNFLVESLNRRAGNDSGNAERQKWELQRKKTLGGR
jgi:hypothetical protein